MSTVRIAILLTIAILLVACGTQPAPTSPPQAPIAPTAAAAATMVSPSPAATATPELAGKQVSGLFDAGAGGLKLYIACEGSAAPGTPTVIMDSGLGVDSGTWARVQPHVAGFARVCRYDRAGLGSSVLRGPLPRTSQQMVEELHALLASAGVKPPYVLVGASFGGLNVQLYCIQYPQEVVGLVLVDSLHPEFDERIERLFTPEQVQERRAELSNNPEGVQFADILTSQMQVRDSGNLPDMPLVVLRHGRPWDFSPGWPAEAIEELWVDLQADLAARSSTGRLIVAERAGHRIAEMRPDQVVQAIEDVTMQVSDR